MPQTKLTNSLLSIPGMGIVHVIVFWTALFSNIPEAFSRLFHQFSPWVFLFVLVIYCALFRFSEKHAFLTGLITMVLLAVTLNYRWSSGYSDNFLISGLLPYKDARNYYIGANMLLNGSPLIDASQATERPLFPGFLASLLLVTGFNLKISLALIVQLIGVAMNWAMRQIRSSYGAYPAGLFATLLYFYIQPWVGYSMSETLGFIAGCMGFVLLWLAAANFSRMDFYLGIITLLVAVSARAGAFLVFPLLAAWAGWNFRGVEKYSIKEALSAISFTIVGYWMVNTIHARMLGIPPGSTFGNFSYALYGQVHGGAGWYSAIRELGTRDPAIVYRETFNFFLDHPLSLFIGIAKAYRDFFMFNDASIFPFGGDWSDGLSVLLWLSTLGLLVCGGLHLYKSRLSAFSSLVTAGLLGVLMSIPFLPPVDGGSRFYAGTIPFFFALPALGLFYLSQKPNKEMDVTAAYGMHVALRWLVILCLLALVFFIPWSVYHFVQPVTYPIPACLDSQEPFVIRVYPGSYVNLIQDSKRSCSVAPDICLSDFDQNNVEKNIDDFYQTILGFMRQESDGARLMLSVNLLTGQAHYFYSHQALDLAVPTLVTGCAMEMNTQYQSVFEVQSLSAKDK